MTTQSLKAPRTPIDVLLSPVHRFVKAQSSAGLLLLMCAVAAMIWANSPWADLYHELLSMTVTLGAGELLIIEKPLLLWINDGLMAIFFFVVGLEIKREILAGELTSFSRAALPIAAAIGGMAGPALLYAALNYGKPGINGWGIPMATDIAFAVGVLAILGKRVPLGLKVFLTALAIVDDIGAVLVIALFYTEKLSISALIIAHVLLAVSILMNLLGVRNTLVYIIIGAAMWVAMLKSGVHATIAGVLLAMTIPASVRLNPMQFLSKSRALLTEFEHAGDASSSLTQNKLQQHTLHELEVAAEHVQPPLLKLEHMLVGWVAFFIMPIFALANAGVSLGGGIMSALTDPICYGIAIGLFLGKLSGITVLSWIAVKSGIAALPTNVSWSQVFGASCLAGIGFTMSLFIAGLAFTTDEMLNTAKVGILLGSLISGVTGFVLLYRAGRHLADD